MSSMIVSIAIVVLLIVLAVVFWKRLKEGKGLGKTNYKALFILGVFFMIIGIGSKSSGFFVIGLVFMIVGIINKSRWSSGSVEKVEAVKKSVSKKKVVNVKKVAPKKTKKKVVKKVVKKSKKKVSKKKK